MSYKRIAFSALTAATFSITPATAGAQTTAGQAASQPTGRNVFVLDRDAGAGEAETPPKKKGFGFGTRLFRNASKKADAQQPSDLLIALARVKESGGDFEGARNLLVEAVKEDPDDLEALLAYGRLLDRNAHLDEAVAVYENTVQKHPNAPRAWNDLGLCLARAGRYAASRQRLTQAVQLNPEEKRYRNNLATVLIELGATGEAVAQLSAVHEPAVAHYNAGYLLQRAGRSADALVQFQHAAELDPSLAQAQQWIAHLAPGASAVAAQQQQQPTTVAGLSVSDPRGVSAMPPNWGAAANAPPVAGAAQPPASGYASGPVQSAMQPNYQTQPPQAAAPRQAPASAPAWNAPVQAAPQQAPLPGALPPYLGGRQAQPQAAPRITTPAAAPLPPNTARSQYPNYAQTPPARGAAPVQSGYYTPQPQPANPYLQQQYQAANQPVEEKQNWLRAALPKGRWRL